MSSRTRFVAPFALFALVSCSDDATMKVIDSTGLEARRVCNSDDCETELTGATSCGEDVVLLGGVDFLVLCTSVRDAVFDENCRPVVCSADADAAPAHRAPQSAELSPERVNKMCPPGSSTACCHTRHACPLSLTLT